MPKIYSKANSPEEPRSRFYPVQDMPPQIFVGQHPMQQKNGNEAYFEQRHPVMLRRLYQAADTLLETYPEQGFIYDAYPDYLSLRLLRNRILRENSELTEEFLQAGCPISWLELLTDTILSELLCRKRCHYLKPIGDARTTSV